jgi:hypothetical protein
LVLGGCGGPKVIARVNKDTITEPDFYARMAEVDAIELGNSAQVRGPAKAGVYAMRALLTEKLILQLAASKGATPTETQVQNFLKFARRFPQVVGVNPYRGEALMRRDAEIQVAMRNLMAKPLNITDADVQSQYDKNKASLVEARQYRLRIVEVSTEDKAKAALGKLAKGISFETVALTDSEDPSLRARSGDAGYLPEPAMPASLRTALKGLKPGEYTKAPVRVEAPRAQGQPATTPPHYFLAQIVEIKEPRQIPLDEVRFDLEGRAVGEKDPKAGQRVLALLRDYTKQAKVEVTLKGFEDVAKGLKESASAPITPQIPGGQSQPMPPAPTRP